MLEHDFRNSQQIVEKIGTGPGGGGDDGGGCSETLLLQSEFPTPVQLPLVAVEKAPLLIKPS